MNFSCIVLGSFYTKTHCSEHTCLVPLIMMMTRMIIYQWLRCSFATDLRTHSPCNKNLLLLRSSQFAQIQIASVIWVYHAKPFKCAENGCTWQKRYMFKHFLCKDRQKCLWYYWIEILIHLSLNVTESVTFSYEMTGVELLSQMWIS